ncbi:hypothetical protein FA13DRAFT_1720617 [Coprinellus micaceus]|uniref:Uncharacterized protein n=1 Tax=Coprinellus micaceus TaxID=71717 RepID=A0A4Y7S8D0_COPMI|nr:hypothetical protein FA13DRAFT_1720617 [Coprinellus micaceus]
MEDTGEALIQRNLQLKEGVPGYEQSFFSGQCQLATPQSTAEQSISRCFKQLISEAATMLRGRMAEVLACGGKPLYVRDPVGFNRPRKLALILPRAAHHAPRTDPPFGASVFPNLNWEIIVGDATESVPPTQSDGVPTHFLEEWHRVPPHLDLLQPESGERHAGDGSHARSLLRSGSLSHLQSSFKIENPRKVAILSTAIPTPVFGSELNALSRGTGSGTFPFPRGKGAGDGPTLKLPENNVGPTAHRLPAGGWENGSRPLGATLRNLKVSKFKVRRP